MILKTLCLLLTYLVANKCNGLSMQHTYTTKIDAELSQIDKILHEFNRLSAKTAWDLMISNNVNETTIENSIKLGIAKTIWRTGVCNDLDLESIEQLTYRQKRMFLLLCREPKYTVEQVRKLSSLLDNLSTAYSSAEVCVPKNSWQVNNSQLEQSDGEVCLKGEPDLEKLIKNPNFSNDQLLWVWTSWHNAVGPTVRKFYPRLVALLNEAAVNNGYDDIGEAWRKELEIPHLEIEVKRLFKEIQPLYAMLHAVVRHKLYQKYGSEIIDPSGPIPIHLLGNMWAQDWSALINLITPSNQHLQLNDRIKRKKWTIREMVTIAEDMYVSLGFPKMTDKFWRYSKFERHEKQSNLCHGTAANMFDKNDFRMLLCAELNMEDFYVIHHEMGHIEYYMAYANQPAIFQDGANSAFQESIGDAIMTGVITPQHLYRLGLITDEQLSDEQFEFSLLLEQALTKIPQIPYALLIDQYRWDIFDGKIKSYEYNRAYWRLNQELRGVTSQEIRNESYFDAGAKFHVPDNTPYIRYFLSAILQMEMFNSLCQLTLYGNLTTNDRTVPFPLHKCDIYGSKKAGSKLKTMMSLGASEHWSKQLKFLTGNNHISAESLLLYYKPIYDWLKKYILVNDIPVGW